jgi:hypothetical protein
VELDDIEARLWTISENLHRTELNEIQRAEQVTEFARLTNERLEAQKQAPAVLNEKAALNRDAAVVGLYRAMGGRMLQSEPQEAEKKG